MLWLKEEIKKLESTEPLTEDEIEPRKRWLTGDGEKQMFWQSGDKKIAVTFGQIMADLDWYIEYQLDPQSVPYILRKQYLVERAKCRIKELLDEQITVHESDSEKLDPFKRSAYAGLLREYRGGRETRGHLAEKMVRNFLAKLATDLNLDFEIMGADAHQDVEDKIDFVIRRRQIGRGVRVEETTENIGIQFTIDMREETEMKKRRQIEMVKRWGSELDLQDLVLVRMDLNNLVTPAIREWEKTRPPGGPDNFLPLEIRKEIFYQLLSQIFEPTEIQERWNKVVSRI